MIPLLISILTIGAAIFLYYKKPKRAILRILPVFICYILIINFVFNVNVKKKANPPVLLIDVSASMQKYLPEIIQKTDKLNFSFQRFFFSESLFQSRPEKNQPMGKFTDITSALLKANELKPSSIILISDGNHNYGESPFSKLKNLEMPVYCFGAGAESLRNLSIIDVYYPEYTFINDSVKVEVVVESEGFKGGNGEAILKLPAKILQFKKNFPLSDIRAKNTIEFKILTRDIGEKKVALYLTPQPGEINYEDNEFKFSLAVLEKKIAVLYYTDHLSFNTKFFLRELKNEDNIELFGLARITSNEYLRLDKYQPGIPIPNLEQFDVLIFDNIKFNRLPWQNLKEFLNQGKGMLFIGSLENLTDDARALLPIDITGNQIKGEYRFQITQAFSCFLPGEEYPPFFAINRVIGAKANAVIIAISNNLPIIALAHYEKAIVFQINGIDIGNWQFTQLGLKNKNLLSVLLADLIRFLSPFGKRSRLVLKSFHKDYTLGEVITLKLESFDRNFKPKGGGDFYCQFGDRKVPFFEAKPGIYEGTLTLEKSGEFEIFATGKLDEEVLKSNTLNIRISTQRSEIEKGINKDLLQGISEKTNGKYSPIQELGNFQPPEPKDYYKLEKLNIDSPITYFLILVFFAVDWLLRRREGAV